MRFGGVGLLAQTWANKLSPARAVASLLDSLLLGPDSRVHVLTWVGESVVFFTLCRACGGGVWGASHLLRGGSHAGLVGRVAFVPFSRCRQTLGLPWGGSRAKLT